MKNLVRLILLTNLLAFSGLFYWNFEIQKDVTLIKQTQIAIKAPDPEKVLEYYLIKYEKNWNYKDKQTFLKAVNIASQHYNIEALDIMTYVALESNYTIRPKPRRNSNGTYDYGLTQQNSNYYKGRFRITSKIAKQYNLKYNINDRTDITLQVLSCAYFVNSLRTEIKQKYGSVSHYRMTASYNTGIKGFSRLPTKAKEYYSVFYNLKKSARNNA